jgi:exoribonuclease-2
MSFFVDFDQNFQIKSREIAPTLIEIAHQLTYEEADRLLFAEEGDSKLQFTLAKLWDATCVIEALRLQGGASQFSRREMNAKLLPDGTVGLEEASEDTPSHKLVGEMAILANETAATFCAAQDIPMIFRSQEAPDVNPEEQGLEIPEGPARDFYQRSFLKRSLTTPRPAPHYGLGLRTYLQVTSPIRRASDLINQRQIGQYFRSGQPLYSVPEIEEALVSLEGGLDEAFQIQRERNRYFLLKYLVQQGVKELDATIMKTDGPKPLLELDQVFLISPFHVQGSKEPDVMRKRRGERIRVVIDQIDPRSDTLVLREVSAGVREKSEGLY